ncbi:MAG: hypothetical protein GF401_12330 [Chitinivibrionales bacterium]|nr:hypothetical protein [Chitinivibrionales bacterium]
MIKKKGSKKFKWNMLYYIAFTVSVVLIATCDFSLEPSDNYYKYSEEEMEVLMPTPATKNKLERVLVFTEMGGFKHMSTEEGAEMVKRIGQKYGFEVEVSNNSAGYFTNRNLPRYNVVVWNNNTKEVLSPDEKEAYKSYISNGGGHIGWHGTAANYQLWEWFAKLVGGVMKNHTAMVYADVNINPALSDHVLLRNVDANFNIKDEWYNYVENEVMDKPQNNSKVTTLLTIDENTFQGGEEGDFHPTAWCQEDYDGGRSFYITIGHLLTSFKQGSNMEQMVTNALFWAAQDTAWENSTNF